LIAALLALLAYALTASSPDDSIDSRLAERRAAEAAGPRAAGCSMDRSDR
jgi:hypothetical protein